MITDDAFPIRPWIGRERFGVVERREGEHVETEFVCVLGPAWPVRSFYVVVTDEGVRELPLPLHRRSVALAYLRFYGWMGALVLALPGLIDPARWGRFGLAGLALAAIAAVAQLALGRLSPDERARRDLLHRVVGVGAPPELLPAEELDVVRDGLLARWQRTSVRPWRDAIAAGVADELLVALAEYHGELALAERARASLAPN